MPYEISYLEDEGGIITTYWGTVTDDEIIQSGKEKLALWGKMKIIRFALTDLSQVEDLNLTSKGIQINADISAELLNENSIIVAFVVPDDFGFGMGRMWQAYADHTGAKSNVFRTRSEAEAWIKQTLSK
jgi:hypothetical protein